MKNHSSSRSGAALLPMLGLSLALLAATASASAADGQTTESNWKQAEAPPQLVAVPESMPMTVSAPATAQAATAAVTPPAATEAAVQQAAAPTPAAAAPVAAAATDARAVTEVQAASPEAAGAQAAAPMLAQDAATSPPPEAQEMLEPELAPLQVGDATRNLMGWQGNGAIASTTPRPIAGDVAQRSYARYLKSFEFPIPERFTSTVKSGSSSGSSSQ